jgi:hypothetical protein
LFLVLNELPVRVCVGGEEHSVQGIRETKLEATEFQDNEFVVYDTKQIRMKYLVEVDPPVGWEKLLSNPYSFLSGRELDPEVPKKVEGVVPFDYPSQAKKEEKQGLFSAAGDPIPLLGLHVVADVLDVLATVQFFQEYYNASKQPIEAKYVHAHTLSFFLSLFAFNSF